MKSFGNITLAPNVTNPRLERLELSLEPVNGEEQEEEKLGKETETVRVHLEKKAREVGVQPIFRKPKPPTAAAQRGSL